MAAEKDAAFVALYLQCPFSLSTSTSLSSPRHPLLSHSLFPLPHPLLSHSLFPFPNPLLSHSFFPLPRTHSISTCWKCVSSLFHGLFRDSRSDLSSNFNFKWKFRRFFFSFSKKLFSFATTRLVSRRDSPTNCLALRCLLVTLRIQMEHPCTAARLYEAMSVSLSVDRSVTHSLDNPHWPTGLNSLVCFFWPNQPMSRLHFEARVYRVFSLVGEPRNNGYQGINKLYSVNEFFFFFNQCRNF